MTAQQPILNTSRLILRSFTLDDAPVVQKLAGNSEIALNTLLIPHPYEDGMAEEWISTHKDQFESGKLANFAVVHRNSSCLIGSIGLTIYQEHEKAELGYWIGKSHWRNGYCTEAGKAIIRYGFDELKLNRIHAHHFSRNPASGRVMEKLGMQYEGCLRQHIKKRDKFMDCKMYSILKDEYVPDNRNYYTEKENEL